MRLGNQVAESLDWERLDREYHRWCREHELDPQATASMVTYEEEYDPEWVRDVPLEGM